MECCTHSGWECADRASMKLPLPLVRSLNGLTSNAEATRFPIRLCLRKASPDNRKRCLDFARDDRELPSEWQKQGLDDNPDEKSDSSSAFASPSARASARARRIQKDRRTSCCGRNSRPTPQRFIRL